MYICHPLKSVDTMQKWQPVAEVGWDQIHLVPKFSKVRDASHGSHRVVAPMVRNLAPSWLPASHSTDPSGLYGQFAYLPPADPPTGRP